MLNGYPRILIIRFSAIGDVVRTLPALHILRESFPHAQIDWAIERQSLDIVSDHPALDRVHVFDRPENPTAALRNFVQFCKTLRVARYDLVIDFHGIFKSGIAAWATGAKDRWSFAPPRSRELSHWFATRQLRLPSMLLNRVEENILLCQAAGATGSGVHTYIAIPEDIEEGIEEYMHGQFQSAKRIVAVHVPVERPEKQWPLTHYAELVDLLLSDGRFEVILTWGPGQRWYVEEISAQTRRSPHIAPETPTLKHYASLIRHCDFFVGGDTGPMHIASAMDVPVVAIFGGTSPEKHAPFHKPCRILYAGPRNLEKNLSPEIARNYLQAITPQCVYDACIALLKPHE